jgi:hypothetical protein
MQVDKQKFDALLGKLLEAKPLPKAAIERKRFRTTPKPPKRPAPRP